MHNEVNQIRFKTLMLRSSLFDYSDAYILVKGTMTVRNKAAHDQPNNAVNKKVIFTNCVPFSNSISRINNMSMYNLIEYSDNYSKTFGILWKLQSWA